MKKARSELTSPSSCRKNIAAISLFIVLLISLPLLAVLISLFIVLKKVAEFRIRRKFGSRFAEMMHGSDVVWVLEEENAKSIINVINLVEVDGERPHNYLFDIMKSRLETTLKNPQEPWSKLLYMKNVYSGYCFWERIQNFNVDDFVRPFNFPEAEEIDENVMKELISAELNNPLPHDGKATFAIHVGTKPVKGQKVSKPGNKIYPILYRLHHSLGDGVSLLKMLFIIYGSSVNKNYDTSQSEDLSRKVSEKFKMSMWPKIKMISKAIVFAPWVACSQIMRPCDDNILHGPELTGTRLASWKFDSIVGESLLSKIKKIKNRIPGTTFSDILITCISASFNRYFLENQNEKCIPSQISQIITSRIAPTDFNITSEIKRFENLFSVAMMTIPTPEHTISIDERYSMYKRLATVQRHNEEMKNSPDYLVNFWIMKFAASYLPEPVLRVLFPIRQATLCMSNLPGPKEFYYADDAKLQYFAFLVPTRGTTGVGLSMITYNDGIHFGLTVDKALITKYKDVDNILSGITSEIEKINWYTSNQWQSQQNDKEIQKLR